MDVNGQLLAKTLLLEGLGNIPEVGGLVSGIVGVLWDPSQNTWDTIKQEVENLIEQDISTFKYQGVQDALNGLQNVLNPYIRATGNTDTTEMWHRYDDADTAFLLDLPQFQTPGYELYLLGLFVQFANLHLSLLHDGVTYGATWGWASDTQATALDTLKKTITAYQNYVQTTYAAGKQALVSQTGEDKHAVQPFRAVNNFDRTMTLSILDQAKVWTLFDPTVQKSWLLTREVYSDPYGTADDSSSGDIPLPSDPPAQSITGVRVWATGGNIMAIQLGYSDDSVSSIMGNWNYGSNQPPYGGQFVVAPDNPITSVSLSYGDALSGLQFHFKDKTSSPAFGNANGLVLLPSFNDSLDSILSNVIISSISNFYQQAASCIVFGYINLPPASLSTSTIRQLYITSPSNRTLENIIANQTPAVPLPVLQQTAETEDWDGERTRYFQRLQQN